MSAVQAIIAKFGTPAEFGRVLGLERYNHGHLMKLRMSVPVSYWPRLIAEAKRRRIKGVTYEALIEAHEADAPLRAEMLAAKKAARSETEAA